MFSFDEKTEGLEKETGKRMSKWFMVNARGGGVGKGLKMKVRVKVLQ